MRVIDRSAPAPSTAGSAVWTHLAAAIAVPELPMRRAVDDVAVLTVASPLRAAGRRAVEVATAAASVLRRRSRVRGRQARVGVARGVAVVHAGHGVRGQVEVNSAVYRAHVLVAGRGGVFHHAVHNKRQAEDDRRHGSLEGDNALSRDRTHVSRRDLPQRERRQRRKDKQQHNK